MNVAIVGAGRQGNRLAKAISESKDKITAVVDIDPAAAKSLADIYGCAKYEDWRVVVKDANIDAIVICTPNDSHADISIASLNAGKHVLCEKPMARNPEEAANMIKALKDSKAKFKCGFNHRHHPAVAKAKKIIENGELGEIMFMRCRYGITGRKGYEKDWRMTPAISGGGQLMDQGQHVIDLFRWFGGEIREVTGYVSTNYWNISPIEDNAFAILKSDKGHICSMHVSWTEWKNLFSLEVFGKNAYLKIEGLGGSYGKEKLIRGKRDFDSPFVEDITEFDGPDISFRDEWLDFSSAIKENREPLGNAADGFAAINLTFGIYESSKEGHSVRL